MLKKCITSIFLIFTFTCCFSQVDSKEDELMVLDETSQLPAITQVIPVDSVWAGHPVDFCLLTSGNLQYIAFYNAERRLVAGQRTVDDKKFHLFVFPETRRETNHGTSTILGWDSHNSVVLALDREGFIHLAANMHNNPLTYFRSTVPHDVFSFVQVFEMVGTKENSCTYPQFMNTRDGDLIFHYRDGGSGNGNEIYNIYSVPDKKWSRLLDVPLTDGLGEMNAYQSQPTLMDDNWYHVFWVWRDTPDCSTNHDLSYMKSPDLKNWYNAFNEPVTLPVTFENKSVIVDPIPIKGGIINLAAKLCLDEQNNPVFIYHKYDSDGNLQLYGARLVDGKWKINQITHWNYRWDFSGYGTIFFEVRLKEFKKRTDGGYEFSYWHVKYGDETILLNKDLEYIGKIIKPKPLENSLEAEGNFPGLQVNICKDSGTTDESGIQYVLKWETLPENQDRPRPRPWPEPSRLYLYKIKDN